jgi:hypothetical protein
LNCCLHYTYSNINRENIIYFILNTVYWFDLKIVKLLKIEIISESLRKSSGETIPYSQIGNLLTCVQQKNVLFSGKSLYSYCYNLKNILIIKYCIKKWLLCLLLTMKKLNLFNQNPIFKNEKWPSILLMIKKEM